MECPNFSSLKNRQVGYSAAVSELLFVLGLAIEVAFAALAIRTVVSWVQQPDRRHGNLAMALGSLAILVLLSPAVGAGGPGAQLLTDIALVLFLVSGYGLLMFRDSFVPLSRMTGRMIAVAIIAVGLLAIVVQLPANPEGAHTPLQSLVLVAIIGIWAFCILEPIVTFWLAARGRPPVERARLRAISIGYTGLLLVVVVGTVAGSLNTGFTLLLDLVALAIVPVLYVAFFPPVWLRRIWRQPEEDQLRDALHDLLLYSPDRVTLAERALGWAERLVGGDAAFMIDSDGAVLASRGIQSAEAKDVAESGRFLRSNGHSHTPWREGPSVIVPLDLQQGRGAMVIRSERLTPIFGDEELGRLHQYATSLSAGLDRVTLSSKIEALERAKTDFLNIASHELRGPMTVIKGYLTMLDAGALGDLSPKAQSVLPLLISKSDEVNWMIEQMIEASRLEEGRLALKRHRTDIVELTDSAIDGVRMLLTGHELKVDVPVETIEADVDPDRFQIVVRNLLSNAAKYSASGTDIIVEVRRNGDKAFVSVSDRGVGISQEDQRQLFTRFSRIESAAHVQGTGLGLWLSREIARMHDGDLTVESRTGLGSTFTFSVPITK
jgi:signal transduction histidine kinase